MAKLPSVWLQELTWQDVDAYLKGGDDVVLCPIGSTEQHGPAGPLGVDSYAAIALAEDAAKEAGVLVTPPMWFGDSPHHLDFPGTISLRPETLIAVVQDMVRSLARNGFKKFVVINGHKGTNLAALQIACRNLHQYELPDILIALADPLYLARGIAHIKDTAEHHAGELEISHVWHKFPHLIREDKLTNESVNMEPLFSEFVHNDLFGKGGDGIEVFWSSAEQRSFTPTGSFSDSSQASPEKGRQYHEYMVANLAKFIEWMKGYQGLIGSGC